MTATLVLIALVLITLDLALPPRTETGEARYRASMWAAPFLPLLGGYAALAALLLGLYHGETNRRSWAGIQQAGWFAVPGVLATIGALGIGDMGAAKAVSGWLIFAAAAVVMGLARGGHRPGMRAILHPTEIAAVESADDSAP